MTRKQRTKNYPRKVEALVSDAHYELLQRVMEENGFKGIAQAVRFIFDEYTDYAVGETRYPTRADFAAPRTIR